MREHDTICELVSYPAKWRHTIENEPPCGGACKKAQCFNRCEGCPTAEEATGRVRGVNPIGRSRPHTSIHASDGQQAACDTETHPQGRATDRPHRSPPHLGGQRHLWAMLQFPLESARSWPLTANRRRRWEGAGGVGEPGRASRHGGARIEVARARGPRSLLARNTGGATSNTRPHMRAPRPADAGRGVLTRRGAKV